MCLVPMQSPHPHIFDPKVVESSDTEGPLFSKGKAKYSFYLVAEAQQRPPGCKVVWYLYHQDHPVTELKANSYPFSPGHSETEVWEISENVKKKLRIQVFSKVNLGAGEMARGLRAPAALPEVLSSTPSTHKVAHHHL